MPIGDLPTLENKENPKRRILEIGPGREESYFKKYNIEVPKDVVYEGRHIDWSSLPDPEKQPEKSLLYDIEDGSIDEVVMSNILSDSWRRVHSDLPKDQQRIFWNIYKAVFGQDDFPKEEHLNDSQVRLYRAMYEIDVVPKYPAGEMGPLRAKIDYVLKLRTLREIKRVLKRGGVLKLYENFNRYEPGVFDAIIKYLQNSPEFSFSEDTDEEKRLQQMMDKENNEYLASLRRPLNVEMGEHLLRPHNNVYLITKR